jgi:hypothetical protein
VHIVDKSTCERRFQRPYARLREDSHDAEMVVTTKQPQRLATCAKRNNTTTWCQDSDCHGKGCLQATQDGRSETLDQPVGSRTTSSHARQISDVPGYAQAQSLQVGVWSEPKATHRRLWPSCCERDLIMKQIGNSGVDQRSEALAARTPCQSTE